MQHGHDRGVSTAQHTWITNMYILWLVEEMTQYADHWFFFFMHENDEIRLPSDLTDKCQLCTIFHLHKFIASFDRFHAWVP